MKNNKNLTLAKMSKSQKKKTMIEAIHQTLGNVTASTKITGISRSLHYKWMEEDKEYRLAIEEAIEMDLDFTEAALRKNIQAGKEASIIFHLKTKGKHRGYVDAKHSINTKLGNKHFEYQSTEELVETLRGQV